MRVGAVQDGTIMTWSSLLAPILGYVGKYVDVVVGGCIVGFVGPERGFVGEYVGGPVSSVGELVD